MQKYSVIFQKNNYFDERIKIFDERMKTGDERKKTLTNGEEGSIFFQKFWVYKSCAIRGWK